MEQIMNSDLEIIKRKFKLVKNNAYNSMIDITTRVMTNDKYRKFNNFLAKNPAAKMVFNIAKSRGAVVTFMGLLVVAGLADPSTMAYAATIDDASNTSDVPSVDNSQPANTSEQPSAEEPVIEEAPIAEEPVIEEEPIVEESVTDASIDEVPVQDQPVVTSEQSEDDVVADTTLDEEVIETATVDGVEIPVDDASDVVIEDTSIEEVEAEEDIVVNVSDFEDEKGFAVAEGQEVEIIFDPVTAGEQTTLVVFEGPDGQKYVAMTPEAGLSHDSKMNAFADLYNDGKIPYNPYDSDTWPAEWVAERKTPTVEWLTGVLDEGSHYDTILGGFDAKYDENGNLHFWNDGTQAFNVVNTEEGATKGYRPESDSLVELNKGQVLTPPEEPTPVEPTPDPEPTPKPEKTPDPGALPQTGDDNLATIATLTAIGAGAGALIAYHFANNKNNEFSEIDGYSFNSNREIVIDSPISYSGPAPRLVKRR